MTYLVTGGTGFIGKRVVNQLLSKGVKVVSADIDIKNNKDPFEYYLNQKNTKTNNLELCELDISSKDAIQKIISDNKISHIIACGYQMSNLIDSNPVKGAERARKNVETGKGVSIGGALGKRGGTTYEFSTSNPMWRASLETLDFLPLTTVDYSGGIIVTDWYTDTSSSEDAIKISIRFLANDIRSESLKVTVHKKTCLSSQSCKVVLLSNSKIRDKLHSTILRKAALLEKKSKEKK